MRVHVLGGGIIGLACADELLTRGHDVTVIDPEPGSGASSAAAGMLSPSGEAWFGEPDLLRLGVESALRWPSYAARLGVPLHGHGTLLVGHDAGDFAQVQRQVVLLNDLDMPADLLSGSETRALEPGLTAVVGGARVSDRAVDPRAVVRALLVRLGERVVASTTDTTGTPDATVIATGARLPAPFTPLVRGVRGEVVRIRMQEPPQHVVRAWTRGDAVYIVPRAGGEVVLGATAEEHDEAPVVTAGGVLRLLRAGRDLMPALEYAEFLATEARDRPATRDHLPLVGPTHLPDTWLAAGLFRHGVLLAPLTAHLLADALEGAEPDPALDPRRFVLRKEAQCT